MGIKEYTVFEGLTCEECGTTEDVIFDEDGNEICTDCLFERESMEEFLIPTL